MILQLMGMGKGERRQACPNSKRVDSASASAAETQDAEGEEES